MRTFLTQPSNSRSESLALTHDELIQMCGIDTAPQRPTPEVWVPVTLVFHGAEHYVLHAERAEVCLQGRDGGFGLRFRGAPLVFPMERMLGPSVRSGLLTDIRIRFSDRHLMPELSLAGLIPNMYPMVLREDGEVIVK